MHSVLLAAFHEFGIAHRVGRDNDNYIAHKHVVATAIWLKRHTLSLEGNVDIFEHLHGVGAAAFLLGVEEDVALFWDPAMDHVEEDRPEGLLHIRPDPDEEPVVELQAGREHSTDSRAGADRNAAPVKMAEVRETSEL